MTTTIHPKLAGPETLEVSDEANQNLSVIESVEPVGMSEAAEPSQSQVPGEAAEASISEKRIGERIKYLRLKKGMGLVELGRHTGLSASFLSQLETGRVVPTLRNLARIAMVFSKDLSYFFDPEPQMLFRIHKAEDRQLHPQTGVEDPSYFFESLGYLIPDRQLDPYFAEFLPAKEGRQERPHQHAGYEFLYLLSGEMDLRHGEVTTRLATGDAAYFDSSTTHSYVCAGEAPANAIIVTMHGPALHSGSGSSSGAGVRASQGRSRLLAGNGHQPAPASQNGNGAGLKRTAS